MQHCSIREISPDRVTDEVVEEYFQRLKTLSFVLQPRKHVQNLVRTWNQVAERISGWPDIRLSPILSRQTIMLPLTTFPSSFQAELQAWLDRLAGRDPPADLPFKPLRPVSLRWHRDNLVRCASILVHLGHRPNEIGGLATLVQFDNAKAVLRWYIERHAGKPSTQTHHISCVLHTLARHGLRLEDSEEKRLVGLLRKGRVISGGMTTKNRSTLRVFEDERLIHAFHRLPETLMRRALANSQPSHRDAYAAAQALAIAILSCAPVRIENLYGIELDRHIVRVGSGRGQRSTCFSPRMR